MKLEAFAPILPLADARAGDIEIAGIASDSRRVAPGFLFAALKGSKDDGSRYVGDAISRGATAVVVARGGDHGGASVPLIEVDDPRLALAQLAAIFHGRQPATMVAVTGTSGKTSVASFTRQIWARAGLAAASIGTTGVIAPGRIEYGSLTTPDPVALHALLAELCDGGVTHAAMEASSHGLDQRRLDGVRLAAGAFTNLGHDHLDYHSSLDEYHAAKMRLFDALLPKGAPAVIFVDDEWSDRTIAAAAAAGLDVRAVGRKGDFLQLKRVEHERYRQRAEIVSEGRIHEIELPLAGGFQLSNALVAAGLAISTGLSPETALEALAHLEGASGRLELVGTAANGAPAYVDYAHKPEALENVLSSVRPFTTGRVVVVFGCGGDRDRLKRPIMGEIASRLADVVIVTDDNPRSEEPASIRAAIMAMAKGATEIGDRREAIRQAVSLLQPGDTLIVAGKGHEEGQTIGEETHHFSDHEEVRAALSGAAA